MRAVCTIRSGVGSPVPGRSKTIGSSWKRSSPPTPRPPFTCLPRTMSRRAASLWMRPVASSSCMPVRGRPFYPSDRDVTSSRAGWREDERRVSRCRLRGRERAPLVGVETLEPVVSQEAMEANFTNEGGFGRRTRLLKNVMGLWILQECRRQWAREGNDHSYEELALLAEDAPPAGPLVDPDHPTFLSPGDMPSRIRSFCEETGQDPPEEPASVARCVFESLALKYRYAIEQARSLTGRTVERVNVVGGGSQNDLLCQLTADAARLPVVAGPVEATAIGNVMVQAFAQDRVGALEEIRAVVRDSFQASTYEPGGDPEQWSGLHERFSRVIEVAQVLDIPEGG